MNLEEIEAAIWKLSPEQRSALAEWLLDGLDNLSEPGIETLWAEEVERRVDEMDRGLVESIPVEEALRRARAAISARNSDPKRVIAIGEFTARVSRTLNEVVRSGDPVVITRRGKRLVEILPLRSSNEAPVPGKLSETLVFEKDIVSPAGT